MEKNEAQPELALIKKTTTMPIKKPMNLRE